jgi:hypothetical protein
MATKKQTNTKSTKNYNQEVKNNDTVKLAETNQNNEYKSKKSIRKPGRTILVKTLNGVQFDEDAFFNNFQGLTNKASRKVTNSFFLTFDTVANAVKAFQEIRADAPKFLVKFCYYRVFFTMEGLTSSTDYNDVKKQLTTYVTDKTTANVLYCRFYRKNNNFIGCGDFTVDTMEGMNMLVSKEGGLKEYSLNDTFKGTFYRYNGNKNKNEENVETN